MVINEIVEQYKGLEKPTNIEDFYEVLCNDEEAFSKYHTKDVDDTFRYLKRRKQLLTIADRQNNGWKFISKHMALPLEFIAEFRDRVYWDEVSYNIPYNEEFLDEFADRVNWKVLFLKYDFNKDFLYRHQDHIRTDIIRAFC